MALPLEQRVRELDGRVCIIEKLLNKKLGINTLEIVGISGAASIFSEALMGTNVLYIDREGMTLRIINSTNQVTPGTRQCWFNPATGIIFLDPTDPISTGGEVFWIIYIK